MIINLRGTHGSGKSTVVAELIRCFNGAAVKDPDKPKKPLGYVATLPNGKTLGVVGPYHTACGGCDAIQPYSLIWPRVMAARATCAHVIFEGALVSSSYGNIGRASEEFGDEFVFAFMDTPLEVCLERIRARREARGDMRPLNPDNTTKKAHSVERSKAKFEGRRVVEIDHTRAVDQVLEILNEH